jgi:ketosteroid isomerase-like protein
MDKRLAMGLVVLPVLAAGCRSSGVDLEAEGEALMQLSRDWSTLVAKGDMESALGVWAEDAVVLAPGMPVFEGRESIRSYVEGAARIPGFQISWEPVSVHLSDCGDMAYMIERNAITVNDSLGNPVTTYGKGVTVWRKGSGGEWKNVADIWNEAMPIGD